ncbi:hypothetical protein HZI73_07040 [Vallitalea pronyensis]|uniref:Uncharacterized protein n=1 Tax=Vallitalea pronyensis TaxID=1348613 RepID=A0A8J8MIT8_9FIRM|nr:hypothetical protein [Vallitalea pronyensis]QUI22068.1 hypothetical protein HZI73_07040 [Vallitalea pronyensis]
MSYHEKRTIVIIITELFILAAYCIYTYSKYQSGDLPSGDMKAWAGIMLVFIGLTIGVTIVVQIIFNIILSVGIAIQEKRTNGMCDDKDVEKTIDAEMVSDERDKLIELKSMRLFLIISGIGFVVSLATQVLNYSPAVLLNVLFISFSVGSLFEGLTQIYFYRRGIKNG